MVQAEGTASVKALRQEEIWLAGLVMLFTAWELPSISYTAHLQLFRTREDSVSACVIQFLPIPPCVAPASNEVGALTHSRLAKRGAEPRWLSSF